MRLVVLAMVALTGWGALASESVFTTAPPDERAIRVSGPGDDASATLQQAIDAAATSSGGIVLVAEGEYVLSRPLSIYKGVRLIGFGSARPRFVLADNTPGYAEGARKYLVHFAHEKPPAGQPPRDATNDTFASGLLNVDLAIGEGNGEVAAIRYSVAQLCIVKYVDIELAGDAIGLSRIGNEIAHCRIRGGRFGIVTGRTSAGWQSLVLDCVFEGQREAAISTTNAGLTMLDCTVRDTPRGIVVPEGQTEQLYVERCRFEAIGDAAIVADASASPLQQLNVRRCASTAPLARIGEQVVAADKSGFSFGLTAETSGGSLQLSERVLSLEGEPAVAPRAWRRLPPVSQWSNARVLGCVGDGKTDDTKALQAAVDAHRVVYLPMGDYRISDTIRLRPDSVLFGLHSRGTRLSLAPSTAGFTDRENGRAMLLAPGGGTALVSGIGFAPANNPGATAIAWESEEGSLLDDIYIAYGGGPLAEGQAHGIWVRNGGGGVIKNVWAPNDAALTGLYVRDTTTPGEVYLVSIEHHRDTEIVMERVRNWTLYAPQTETLPAGLKSVGVVLVDCDAITLANLYLYRSSSQPEPFHHGMRIEGGGRVEVLGLRNFSWGKNPYQNAVWLKDLDLALPQRDLGRVRIGAAR